MKFMPQDIFDVAAMVLVKLKIEDPIDGRKTAMGYLDQSYSEFYPGDDHWLSQADKLSDEVIKALKLNSNKAALDVLNLSIRTRMDLDENMKEKGALKKIFRGALFTSNHPSPTLRSEVGLRNIKYLFGAVSMTLLQ